MNGKGDVSAYCSGLPLGKCTAGWFRHTWEILSCQHSLLIYQWLHSFHMFFNLGQRQQFDCFGSTASHGLLSVIPIGFVFGVLGFVLAFISFSQSFLKHYTRITDVGWEHHLGFLPLTVATDSGSLSDLWERRQRNPCCTSWVQGCVANC